MKKGGWVGEWVEGSKSALRIAYSNQHIRARINQTNKVILRLYSDSAFTYNFRNKERKKKKKKTLH